MCCVHACMHACIFGRKLRSPKHDFIAEKSLIRHRTEQWLIVNIKLTFVPFSAKKNYSNPVGFNLGESKNNLLGKVYPARQFLSFLFFRFVCFNIFIPTFFVSQKTKSSPADFPGFGPRSVVVRIDGRSVGSADIQSADVGLGGRRVRLCHSCRQGQAIWTCCGH